MTLNVLYLAHDLGDPAIRRRVLSLKAGGAGVVVAGFKRGANVLTDEQDVPTIVLGRTVDARFAQRIRAVFAARLTLGRKLAETKRPDVIIARNLEMLALAGHAASLFGGDIPVVYECLDIHRLLLDDGIKGRLMRQAQRYFASRASLLITSSPAFVENFFKPKSGLDLPILLLENKVLALKPELVSASPAPRPPAPGMPWRIGWFGAIRCRKSLDLLIDFATRMEGKVEIVLRGRPSYSEFDDFDAKANGTLHMEFHGPYRNPEDLAAIYRDVHFTWAVDFFEEGLNSSWLLPNRLYEGGLHGAVPITLSGTETARFVEKEGIGVTLGHATPEALQALFNGMTEARYRELASRVAAVDRSRWVAGPAECRALVSRLAALHPSLSSPAEMPEVSTVRS